MNSPKLTEAQEKIIDDLNWTIKEIRQICRPWSNVPRDNQPMLDACDIFFWKLRDSGDVSLVWNKSLQATLNTIIPPQGFPEVYKHLVMWIFDVVSELGQKSELDKNVQWVVATVVEAAKTWVEMREEVEHDYDSAFDDFKLKLIEQVWFISPKLEKSHISVNGKVITITTEWVVQFNFWVNLEADYQWKSWNELMNKTKLANPLIGVESFKDVLRWLNSMWITDNQLQAKLFGDVLGLSNGIYLCEQTQYGKTWCWSYIISGNWVVPELIDRDKEGSEIYAITW
jgi:hypothetical protein